MTAPLTDIHKVILDSAEGTYPDGTRLRVELVIDPKPVEMTAGYYADARKLVTVMARRWRRAR